MLGRRGFLGALFGGAAAIALDPELALWVPGKKLISIPKPSGEYLKSTSGMYVINPPLLGTAHNLFNPKENVYAQWQRDRVKLKEFRVA